MSHLLPFLSPPLVFLAPARQSASSARPSVGAAPGDDGHQDRNAVARRRWADARKRQSAEAAPASRATLPSWPAFLVRRPVERPFPAANTRRSSWRALPARTRPRGLHPLRPAVLCFCVPRHRKTPLELLLHLPAPACCSTKILQGNFYRLLQLGVCSCVLIQERQPNECHAAL